MSKLFLRRKNISVFLSYDTKNNDKCAPTCVGITVLYVYAWNLVVEGSSIIEKAGRRHRMMAMSMVKSVLLKEGMYLVTSWCQSTADEEIDDHKDIKIRYS